MVLTDGWVVTYQSPNFESFASLSNTDKRIQVFIDNNRNLPVQESFKIYQKDKNIIIAWQIKEWLFYNNNFLLNQNLKLLPQLLQKELLAIQEERYS